MKFAHARLFTRCMALAVVLAGSLVHTSRAEALHCGTHLIERGDPMVNVRSYCGDPATMVSRTEVRTAYGTTSGVTYGAPIATTVQIDTWTFDFGPMRFMEEIVFENGIVYATRPLGYGTPRGRSRDMLKATTRTSKRFLVPRLDGVPPGR